MSEGGREKNWTREPPQAGASSSRAKARLLQSPVAPQQDPPTASKRRPGELGLHPGGEAQGLLVFVPLTKLNKPVGGLSAS